VAIEYCSTAIWAGGGIVAGRSDAEVSNDCQGWRFPIRRSFSLRNISVSLSSRFSHFTLTSHAESWKKTTILVLVAMNFIAFFPYRSLFWELQVSNARSSVLPSHNNQIGKGGYENVRCYSYPDFERNSLRFFGNLHSNRDFEWLLPLPAAFIFSPHLRKIGNSERIILYFALLCVISMLVVFCKRLWTLQHARWANRLHSNAYSVDVNTGTSTKLAIPALPYRLEYGIREVIGHFVHVRFDHVFLADLPPAE
jgi:hypothetical protein